MLLRYVHVFRVRRAARRMLRRSWGCEVGEIGEALLVAEVRLWEGTKNNCGTIALAGKRLSSANIRNAFAPP